MARRYKRIPTVYTPPPPPPPPRRWDEEVIWFHKGRVCSSGTYDRYTANGLKVGRWYEITLKWAALPVWGMFLGKITVEPESCCEHTGWSEGTGRYVYAPRLVASLCFAVLWPWASSPAQREYVPLAVKMGEVGSDGYKGPSKQSRRKVYTMKE